MVPRFTDNQHHESEEDHRLVCVSIYLSFGGVLAVYAQPRRELAQRDGSSISPVRNSLVSSRSLEGRACADAFFLAAVN